MAITLVSVGPQVTAAYGSVATVPLPPDYVLGDFLVCLSVLRSITGTLSVASPWTDHVHPNSANFDMMVSYCKADGTESAAVITPANTTTGQTHMHRVLAFRGVKLSDPVGTPGSSNQNGPQLNVGPIPACTPASGEGAVLVFGSKLGVWTSVDVLTGNGLVWEELFESLNTTIGNSLAAVADWATYKGGIPTLTTKTFIVTGGDADSGNGVMISMNADVPMTIIGVGALAANNYLNASQPPLPLNIVKDDFLICFTVARVLTGSNSITSSWDIHAYDILDNYKLLVSYRRANGSSDSPPTITPSGFTTTQKHVSRVVAVRGVDKTNPFGIAGAGVQVNTSQNLGPIPAVTPLKNVGAVIVFGAKLQSWTSVDTLTGDSLTWTELFENISTTPGNTLAFVLDVAFWVLDAPPTITNKTFVVTGGTTDSVAGKMILLQPSEVVDQPFYWSYVHKPFPHRFMRRRPMYQMIPQFYHGLDPDPDPSLDFDYTKPFVRPVHPWKFRGIIMPQGYPARDPDADISGDFYTSKIMPRWRNTRARHYIPTPDTIFQAAPFTQSDYDHNRIVVPPKALFNKVRPHLNVFNVRPNTNTEVDPDTSLDMSIVSVLPPIFRVSRVNQHIIDTPSTSINTPIILDYNCIMANFNFFGLIAPSVFLKMIATMDPFLLSSILESWIPIQPDDDDWIPLDLDQ